MGHLKQSEGRSLICMMRIAAFRTLDTCTSSLAAAYGDRVRSRVSLRLRLVGVSLSDSITRGLVPVTGDAASVAHARPNPKHGERTMRRFDLYTHLIVIH